MIKKLRTVSKMKTDYFYVSIVIVNSVSGLFLVCLSSHVSSPYRTESVAEKMLTNWFTFLLYKFLKVRIATT